MAKTVIGLFDDVAEARDVIRELVDAGFDRNDISLVANKVASESAPDEGTGEASGAATGAGVGAAVGGVGGLLVGLGAFAIPGVGPVVGAGWLVATLVGAGIGAATGGLVGALADAGVPEEHAQYYSEGVRRGGTLVALNAPDERADRAAEVMRSHGAVDIERRGKQYREGGFSGLDQKAKPYTAAELRRERESYRNPGREDETASPVAGGVLIYSRVTEKRRGKGSSSD